MGYPIIYQTLFLCKSPKAGSTGCANICRVEIHRRLGN